jgi:hypothetical protein
VASFLTYSAHFGHFFDELDIDEFSSTEITETIIHIISGKKRDKIKNGIQLRPFDRAIRAINEASQRAKDTTPIAATTKTRL